MTVQLQTLRPLFALSCLTVGLGACGTAPAPQAAKPAAQAPSTEPQPSAESAPNEATASAETTGEPPAAVEPTLPPRDPETAQRLLEDGRAVQREKGEGGADEAIALYEQALAADPLCEACYWELGWSRQLKDDWAGCIAAWDKVREINPEFPELDVHFPVALMRKQQAEALAALPDATDLPPVDTEPYPGPTITLRAVGDVQLGRAWPEHRAKLPPNDAKDMFAHVSDELQKADITFGNLETALRDEGDSTKCGPKSTKCFAFRVPTIYADALKAAGFDVMSIANNHAGDFGEEGRKATIKALDERGIHHSGPIGDLASFESNGLKIGLVALSTGGGVYRVQEIETAQKVVAELNRNHDLVIVSFHGGAEGTKAAHVPQGTEMFLGENRGDLRKLTHAVVDAGADLVWGHGPHLWRGVELYKGRLIAYSMGNYSSWNTFSLRAALGLTGILETKLAPNGVLLEAQIIPQYMKDPGLPMPDKKARVIDHVRKLSKEDFGDAFFDKKGRWKRAGKPVG